MTIGVISRHSVANYRSLLQAYALQTVLEKMGYNAININYTPINEVGGNLAKTLVNNSRWSKNPFTKMAFLAYQYPSFSHTFNTFKKFRTKYLKETVEYYSSEEMKNDLSDVDIFCTGSDQVWNKLYNDNLDPAYFLDFAPDEKKRIAYAASFGGNKFDTKDAKYIELLKKYSYITVREDTGVSLLSEMGLESSQVLDPTLLLNKQEWDLLVEKKEKREPYYLIYQLKPNKQFDEYAKKISKKYHKKLIRVTPFLFQIIKCGKLVYLPNPSEFLWFIKNADCLLTDSFHGSCFAINFNVPFIEILPGKYNARNESLLRTFKLNNRILHDYNNISIVEEKIDYGLVNKLIAKYRIDSIKQLEKMIGV